MVEAVTVAIISGGLTLAGTALTVWAGNRKTTKNYEIHQAVIDEKIENLTNEVRKHNGFAERIPVLEEQMKSAKERINNLEKGA